MWQLNRCRPGLVLPSTKFLLAAIASLACVNFLVPIRLHAWQTSGITLDEETFFETKIRPVLANSCIECHGPNKASGGLRLDSQADLRKGGDSGIALEPGSPETSLLIRALRHEGDLKMPPDQPLSGAQIDDFMRWIEAGAKWPAAITAPIASDKKHWAFQPLSPIAPPPDISSWAEQPLDRFIAAQWSQRDLHPVPLASKQVLLRRAYLDLVGLAPSAQQIESFLADDSPDAWDNVIDQLLSSQRYGERWGRHWLDLVRYADTAGDNSDYPIPQAYLYRDYVIDAFNADLPYDRFLHEQLAGDILAGQLLTDETSPDETSAERAPESEYARLVIATGFIAQSKRIGTRELEDMHLIIEDTLSTLGPALMGLSLRCARCHDHKFEPLSMADYYALYGFFASTQYPFAGAEEVRKQTKFAPLVLPDEVQRHRSVRQSKIDSLKSQIESLEKVVAQPANASNDTQAAAGPTGNVDQGREAELKELKKQLSDLDKSDPLEGLPTAYAVGELTPTDVAVQPGGNPHAKDQPIVKRGVPKVLDSQPLEVPPGASGRLELARWMTSRASHLTARVMVNRLWQYHFGKPLVATPSDFGLRGEAPSHPELLDWLAGQFVDSGWSIKAMHRLIMRSKTYQLSSQADAHNVQIDGGNVWYWRFDRRRMDAESLRDTLLALAGTLDLNRPGAHPFPEPSTWRYTAHHQFNDVCYPSHHRSVYLMVQRLHAHPYLSLFNGADPSLSTPRRDDSTVPLQALYLLNSPFAHEAATNFGRRIALAHTDNGLRLRQMLLEAYGRLPTEMERERCQAFIDRYRRTTAESTGDQQQAEIESWAALARTVLVSNEFFFVD